MFLFLSDVQQAKERCYFLFGGPPSVKSNCKSPEACFWSTWTCSNLSFCLCALGVSLSNWVCPPLFPFCYYLFWLSSRISPIVHSPSSFFTTLTLVSSGSPLVLSFLCPTRPFFPFPFFLFLSLSSLFLLFIFSPFPSFLPSFHLHLYFSFLSTSFFPWNRHN